MTSRERTFLALEHQEPDRVPVDFWASQGLWAKLGSATGMDRRRFLDAHDVDLRYIDGPRYVGPPLQSFPDGSEADLWGVGRRTVRVTVAGGEESYREVVHSPLASAADKKMVGARSLIRKTSRRPCRRRGPLLPCADRGGDRVRLNVADGDQHVRQSQLIGHRAAPAG